jgi:hypothetical protein
MNNIISITCVPDEWWEKANMNLHRKKDHFTFRISIVECIKNSIDDSNVDDIKWVQ